jgi:putative tricarboxylic transport membrane protein
MGKADRISGLFWLLFGIIITIESHRLGLGTVHSPGPGFLFFYAGIFVSLMALIILVRAWGMRRGEETGETLFAGRNIRKLVYVLISVFLYAILMEWLGFLLVTLLLFVVILAVIEKKRWPVAVLTSIAVTGIAYLVFQTALKSQLPKGPFGF